jgi:hypothetical protein
VLYLSGTEAGRIRRHQEPPHPVLSLGPHDGHVGNGSVTDPPLAAVQYPVVSVSSCERLHARGIAPVARFRQPEATDQLTRCHPRKPLLLLLLATELPDGRHRERSLNGRQGPYPAVARLQLHAFKAILNRAMPWAAIAAEVSPKNS